MRKYLALFVQVPFVALMWSACGPGGGTSDGGPDGTTTDVVSDKKMLPDVGPADTGGDGNNTSCTPSSTVSMSDVPWVPPTAPNPTACTDVAALAIYNGCLGSSATSSACSTAESAYANCAKCLFSTAGSSSTYGALIAFSGVDYANTGGCIAIELGDQSATGCGAKNEAVLECEYAACASNCPSITDQTTFTEFTTCTGMADQGVCAPYVTAQCDLGSDGGIDGGPAAAAACLNFSSFQDYFNAMATVFCGNMPASDAGSSDAGDGGD